MHYNLYAYYTKKGYDLVKVDKNLTKIKEEVERLNPYDVDKYMIVEKSNEKGDCVIELENLEKPKILRKSSR